MASAPSLPPDPRHGPSPGGGPAGADRWRTIAVCLVLFLGTLGLFSRSLPYGFTNYDDPVYLTGNLHVQGGLSWEGLRWAFVDSRIDFWQPLVWVSHMVDVDLFGSRPWGHHLSSILWHAANAVLVFFLLRRLTGAFWTSAFAAALFAWHPLRVESVTWVTERKDVMSGFFFLLTLWAYAAYAGRRAAGRPARRHYGLTLAAFVSALMCKPVVVVVPALLLLLDWWPLRRLALPAWGPAGAAAGPARGGRPARVLGALLLEKVPFLVLSAAFSLLTLYMQHEGRAFTIDVALPGRIANALVSIPRYLGMFFWPAGLTVVYPHPGTWPTGIVTAAGLAIAAITGAAVWWGFSPAKSAQPWLLTGWGWFLIMLLPNIGLIQVGYQALADRYSYLSMLGLALGLLWSVRAVLPERIPAWIKAGVPAVLLAACAARTWDQQGTWRDSATLFTHALAVTRDNYAAHTFLSYTLLTDGRVPDAEAHAQRALKINPRFSSGYEALALVRLAQGRTADAIAAYEDLLKLTPDSAGTHRELGELYLQLGQPEKAEVHLREALRINPRVAIAYAGLAQLEMLHGRPDAAVADYQQALRLEPRDWTLHGDFAVLLATLRRFPESRKEFEASLRLAPRNVPIRLNFARMLGEAGQPAEALDQARQAAALQPDDPAVLVGLARALEQSGRADEAAANLEQALAANPGDAAVLVLLGDTRARQGRMADAAARYEEALRLRPGDAGVEARLGFALYLARRPAEAVRHWEEALRLAPTRPALRARIERARREAAAGGGPGGP